MIPPPMESHLSPLTANEETMVDSRKLLPRKE